MGNCLGSNKVMSQGAECDSHAPFAEDMKGMMSTALKQPSAEDCDEKKKNKTEKKVRFKLEDDEEGGDLRNKNGGVRRVRMVVTKKELRQILRHAKGSRHSSSRSLEELMVALSSRSKERINNGSSGESKYLRPGSESIPGHHR